MVAFIDCNIHAFFTVHGGDRDFRFGANPIEREHLIRLVYQAWCFVSILVHINAFSIKIVSLASFPSLVDLLKDSLKDDKVLIVSSCVPQLFVIIIVVSVTLVCAV